MRKSKTLEIEVIKNDATKKKEITVKELRVKDYLQFFDGLSKSDKNDTAGFLALAKNILPLTTNDLTFEDLTDFSPSEILEIYNAFKEVNAVFFSIIGQLGLDKVLNELQQQIIQGFKDQCVSSLKPVM